MTVCLHGCAYKYDILNSTKWKKRDCCVAERCRWRERESQSMFATMLPNDLRIGDKIIKVCNKMKNSIKQPYHVKNTPDDNAHRSCTAIIKTKRD